MEHDPGALLRLIQLELQAADAHLCRAQALARGEFALARLYATWALRHDEEEPDWSAEGARARLVVGPGVTERFGRLYGTYLPPSTMTNTPSWEHDADRQIPDEDDNPISRADEWPWTATDYDQDTLEAIDGRDTPKPDESAKVLVTEDVGWIRLRKGNAWCPECEREVYGGGDQNVMAEHVRAVHDA